MKPSLIALHSHCPEVPEEFVANHIERLSDEYFNRFTIGDIASHVEALWQLTPEEPVRLEIDTGPDDTATCTVLGFNYRTQFSLITGILTSVWLVILSGDAFTYGPPPPFVPDPRMPRSRLEKLDPLRRRYIIDRFSAVFADDAFPQPGWLDTLRHRLRQVMVLLETGRGENASRARNIVNQLVAERLREVEVESPVLYPVDIDITNEGTPYTSLRVTSQDTPAFLYALSNALSVWGISIERVRINTVHGMVEDEIGILDARGKKIVDRQRLDRIRLSVLLTKQFTLFLPKAPDPYAALSRFEHLASDVVTVPERGRWLERFSDPNTLKDLAKILGASDFIWEDFVRSQYESLLPILASQAEGERTPLDRESIEQRLLGALAGAQTYEQKKEALNRWKDHEIFLIDLDHILHSEADVRALARPLTILAETVVRKATEIVYDRLVARHGVPRTVGGIRAAHAIFGLGKLGGEALGYASDIELLFIYGDNGRTDGERPIENSEFFNLLVEETSKFIAAKREGIFHVDLRLRPHGDSGPKASSLESFCRYYGVPGDAHSYERLALTRLRAIGGDMLLGLQVERLRDEFVYNSRAVKMDELRQLRERQFETKVRTERYNAKFSAGALVDVEYFVQVLQVMHGRNIPSLRTSRIHEALEALSEAGILDPGETRQLIDAYYFLRHLINGLRMLRGNAVDLFLPPVDSEEYVHLARRMGYEKTRELEPEKQLFIDFETHTAVVRAFIERHFGRESLPATQFGNVVDLVLSSEVPAELRNKVLSRAGLGNRDRAHVNLRRLAGQGAQRDAFIRIAVLAFDYLKHVPDPDMALNNWERFSAVLPDLEAHYRELLSQPKRLEILLRIFAGSQFLSDTLVRNPEFFDWVTNPAILRGSRDRNALRSDLKRFTSGVHDHAEWLNRLRRFRRREILRIGTRDVCLNAPIEEIMPDLSALADALTEAALARVWDELTVPEHIRDPERHFCVLTLGKLGGNELNYSSDIDLVGVYDEEGLGIPSAEARVIYAHVLERLRADLSNHTEEGYVYRVDLRLRPHGRYGELVQSFSSLVDYYRKEAALWELQAALKARPVAGSMELGQRLVEAIRPGVAERRKWETIVASVKRMREKAVQGYAFPSRTDVKSGLGGIRDVEFLIQALQLRHLPDHPMLFVGNTLEAMAQLQRIGALPAETALTLREDYLFLRRVEHYLQLLEDRQTHAIPEDEAQLAALARRAMGYETSPAEFRDRLAKVLERTHETHTRFFG